MKTHRTNSVTGSVSSHGAAAARVAATDRPVPSTETAAKVAGFKRRYPNLINSITPEQGQELRTIVEAEFGGVTELDEW